MAQELCSGFLSFASSEQRDAFLADLAKRRPRLGTHFVPSKIGSRIVVRDISSEELAQLKNLLDNRGRWFDDVQFSTTNFAAHAR